MHYTTSLKIKNIQRVFLFVLCDIIVILAAVQMAVIIRGNDIHSGGLDLILSNYREMAILVLVICSVNGLAGCYAMSWRYSSFKEFFTLYAAATVGCAVSYWMSRFLVLNEALFLPVDYILIWILCLVGFSVERFFAMMVRADIALIRNHRAGKTKKRVMIVGGGDTGSSLIKSMLHEGSMLPVAVTDDDAAKHGMRICGVPVVGGRNDILRTVKEYKVQEIIIAIPSGEDSDIEQLIRICKNTGKKVSTVPSMFELVSGKMSINQLREVTPQELLGRKEQIIDDCEIFGYIEGKTVMVTGGGGSIGSELCRQIARFNPRRLIVFDIYENNAYELQLELRKKYPELKLEILIGSVRDVKRLDAVFEKYKPRVVFHAAAHKHVPLMEDSPNEAIKNNVYGTYNVALMCEKYNAERFVLISTDKAVNPTNVMGASKRIAEMVIQRFDERVKKEGKRTIYAAVRFGNVLGSNGSVIPIFKKQIKEGGPVTITHPEINRFFMTIPEAAQLVMQAGALAGGGEIFILDMGQPVKIVDLARNLIELSGYVPDVDIKIEYTGLRPGEKMYEELLLDKQRQSATKHDRIFIEPPCEDTGAIVNEMYALRDRLACDVPLYDDMLEWFKTTFNV